MPTLKFWNEVTGQWEYILGAAGGYQYLTTLKYESDGSFTKANYPGLRAVKVKVQGGGGGGRGADSNNTGGAGAGGGCYAEGFILADALAAVESVTVGPGGAGGVGGTTGSNGSASSFGSLVTANGGNRGGEIATYGGGRGGASGTGDLVIPGSAGVSVADHTLYTAMFLPGGAGGGSHLGGGGEGSPARAANRAGGPGLGYGGGGGGAFCRNASVNGGDGAPGVVIVEVYV